MLPFPIMNQYGNILPKYEFDRPLQLNYYNKFYLSKEGNLYGYGFNNYGQLGLGHNVPVASFTLCYSGVNRYYSGLNGVLLITIDNRILISGRTSWIFPEVIPSDSWSYVDITSILSNLGISSNDIKDCHISEVSTAILLNDGRILCTGLNSYGDCGMGDTKTIKNLIFNPNISNVKELRGSRYGRFFIDYNQNLYYSGNNNNGTGGINNTNNTPKITYVTSMVKDVGCTMSCTYVFKLDGTIQTCGLPVAGQLGNGVSSSDSTLSILVPTTISTTYNINSYFQVQCNGGPTQGFSPIYRNGSTIYMCGLNTNGNLGIDNTISTSYITSPYTYMLDSPVKYFCSDNNMTIISTESNRMYACGGLNNLYSKLPDSSYKVLTFKEMLGMPWN